VGVDQMTLTFGLDVPMNKIKCLWLISVIVLSITKANAQEYDLVIHGGRVIDPESSTDAILNVGINGGTIKSITTKNITGKQLIDAKGLVVSPGFIDLHAHGQHVAAQTYQIRDGVTTALELEAGGNNITAELAGRKGNSLINYGYSASHGQARRLAKNGDEVQAAYETTDEPELNSILAELTKNLDQGALGIGMPLDYYSRGVDDRELEAIFRLAALRRVPLFVHIRMADDMTDVSGLQELIALTRKTRASLHMVHVVSTGLGRVPSYLNMMSKAQASGLDITTELYPYTAASTQIGASLFEGDWKRKFGISYRDIEWAATGKRFLDKAMWERRRASQPQGIVIVHVMKESWVEQAMVHPGVMIASDGMPIERLDQRAHPRGMGTFSRVLGRYVREKGLLELTDAIARMTYLPARRLESFTPVMKRKGRLQVGADADITVFDPQEVIDLATFTKPNQFSKGIIHVIVDGIPVVKHELLLPNVHPGKAISTLW
jgi:N-acyl-D-aspartate/D-glutamate deacylase